MRGALPRACSPWPPRRAAPPVGWGVGDAGRVPPDALPVAAVERHLPQPRFLAIGRAVEDPATVRRNRGVLGVQAVVRHLARRAAVAAGGPDLVGAAPL